MKRIEIIEQHEDILRLCAMAGVTVEDWQNAEIYRFVNKMRADGHKMDYCVQRASVKYVKSPSTIWRVLKNLDEDITQP